MKKSVSLLVFGLATATILASCGQGGTSSSSQTMSSESSFVPANNLERFAHNILNNNVTLTTDDNWVNTLFFGNNAFIYNFSTYAKETYGKVDTGYLGTDQGIFKFTLNSDNKVVLGRAESVTTVATVSDFMTFPSDLTGDLSLWTETEIADVYTTTNSGLIKKIAEIGGDTDYYYYITDITLDVRDAANKGVLTYKLNGTPLEMTFSSFGTTTASYIDEFYANVPTVKNPTDYPAEMKEDMARILTEALPFYEMSYAYDYDSKRQTLFDYGSGNITDDVDYLFLKNGYTWDKKSSKEVPDSLGRIGFIDNLYYKRLFENGSVKAIQWVEIGWTSGYYMDDYYGYDNVYEKMYPEGMLTITYISNDYYDETRYNSFMSDLCAKYGGFGTYVPFHMSEATYFKGTNYEAYAQTLGVEEYLTFETVYTNDALLKEDLNTYIEALKFEEWEVYSGETLGVDVISLFKNNDDYSINIDIAYKDESKQTTFTVYVGDPVVVGEPITWNQFKTQIGGDCINYAALPNIPEELDELEEVAYADLTSVQRDMREGTTANEVYTASYFGLEYGDDCLKNALIIAASYQNMGYKTTTDETLEKDGTVCYILDTGTYVVEATLLIEEGTLLYAYVIYDPIRG